MAGSLPEAEKSTSVTMFGIDAGGIFLFKVVTNETKVALEAVVKVCKAAVALGFGLGTLFALPEWGPRIIDAVLKALGGERHDQGYPHIEAGCLHIRLQCFTDERFLEVLADYESGRMKERLEEEFSNAGIKVEGLKVEIENLAEVNERKEAITFGRAYALR